MPAELVSCPECQRTLRVPDDLFGKLVKCPTCGETFTADPATQAPAPPPPPAETKSARTSKVGRYDEEDDDRPRRRRPRYERDDDGDHEDDRPQRRRSRSGRDDDDEDDRPRRRRRDLVPHRGSTILVLGIVSFFLFGLGLILGPMAWVMGNNDLAEMRAGRMDREGEGATSAGRTCGMISTLLHAAIILLSFTCFCAGAARGL